MNLSLYLESLEIAGPFDESIADRLEESKEITVYRNSYTKLTTASLFAIHFKRKDLLIVLGKSAAEISELGFVGEDISCQKANMRLCCEEVANADALRRHLPYASPSPIGKKGITFGVGDRLGLATIGQAYLFKSHARVTPIFAQQSLRELSLTDRSYRDVVDCATFAVFKTGFTRPWGADGDHLKEVEWISRALSEGCTMITADLSDRIEGQYMEAPVTEVLDVYGKLPQNERDTYQKRYLTSHYSHKALNLEFNEELLARTVLVYRGAVQLAKEMRIEGERTNKDFDFEISIDETAIPTTPEAHYFMACELQENGVSFTGIAPRFVGEFQKGIDYIGDIHEFKLDMEKHAKIADFFGYKVSVHSSSDKFSVYPVIAAVAGNNGFHVKTSGTNWLLALEVIATVNPLLFRKIFNKAIEVFDTAQKYYHVTPNLSALTDLSLLSEAEFTKVFGNNADRQILHITYGEIFKDEELKRSFFTTLTDHLDDYRRIIGRHIGKHLALLEL